MRSGAIKKVLLISPSDSWRAYGLRLISSYLKLHHIDTALIFLPTYTEIWQQLLTQQDVRYQDRVLKQVCNIACDYDAIGISMMTMDRGRVVSLCRALKELNKPIILGGIHPTVDPDDAVSITGLINIGEGFDSFVEFCNDPSRLDIKNIWHRNKDSVTLRNEIRPAIEDIDTIPFPDYDFKNHFVLLRDKIVNIDRAIHERFMGPIYHLFASMGCPLSCAYCVNDRYKKMGLSYNKFRFHSADYIIREIRYGLSISSKIEYINFPDDGFIAMNEKVIKEFAERYRREIGLPFSIMSIIPGYLTEKKISPLVSAGLKRVRVGLQSANFEALQLYKRPAIISRYTELNNILQSHRSLVFPYYDIILDNPFIDTEKDTFETIQFLRGLKGSFTLFLYSLRLYPGTELYEKSLPLRLSEHYYKDSYIAYDNTLLNYIMTIIQCSQNETLISFGLLIYRKFGNIRIPKFLFFINSLIFMMRCGIEHIRKQDISGLPAIFARCFFKKRSARPS